MHKVQKPSNCECYTPFKQVGVQFATVYDIRNFDHDFLYICVVEPS
jgi:hypothetical protein